MTKAKNIIWGILLVAIGIVWALNNFGITSVHLFFDGWWTLFIIVPCVIGLFTDYDKTGNIVGICIGVFLLLCCRDILRFDMFWKLLVPGIIVIIGLKMVFGGAIGNRGDQVYRRITAENGVMENRAAVFSGSRLDSTGERFEGAQLDAIFGSVTCDLTKAVIDNDCVINATAVFGGIDIYVPENVNVRIKSNSLFGGVSGKERRDQAENQYTLYINAIALFGGVKIK